jgi:hypothetical protein
VREDRPSSLKVEQSGSAQRNRKLGRSNAPRSAPASVSAPAKKQGFFSKLVSKLKGSPKEARLFHHESGEKRALPQDLQKASDRAVRYSKTVAHADEKPEYYTPKGVRVLHRGAAREHFLVAKKLKKAGFHKLANTHLLHAKGHVSRHNEWARQLGHRELAEPSLDEALALVPFDGHARGGHTLPEQPNRPGDVPTAAPSAKKAKRDSEYWNDQVGEYQEVPEDVGELITVADEVSQAVDRISRDRGFTDEEKANHNYVAASRLMDVAQALTRYGFTSLADDYRMQALGHITQASKHVATSKREIEKSRTRLQ